MNKYLKYTAALEIILIAIFFIIFNIITRSKNPEYTETQLLIRYWKWYGALLIAILAQYFVFKDKT